MCIYGTSYTWWKEWKQTNKLKEVNYSLGWSRGGEGGGGEGGVGGGGGGEGPAQWLDSVLGKSRAGVTGAQVSLRHLQQET